MRLRFPIRVRHPYYPGLSATPAAEARARCAALSGTLAELRRAGALGVRPRQAVFVLNFLNGLFLRETERDGLWEMFLVPVYGLLLDSKGKVVGYECEAQNGLHLAEGASVPSGEHAVLETAPCACRRPGKRLVLTAVPSLAVPTVATPFSLPL
jgi:hypothetical protein